MHATPAVLAEACEVIITMVTGTADVEEVLIGPQGVVHGARPGTVAIDMSTISPVGTRHLAAALAARGVEMLDAPVTGGVAGAEHGTLTIMVGGEQPVLERVRPVLTCLGNNIVYMGGPERAKRQRPAINWRCSSPPRESPKRSPWPGVAASIRHESGRRCSAVLPRVVSSTCSARA